MLPGARTASRLAGALLLVGLVAVPPPAASGQDATTEAQRAPIVFLPGLVASELACGPLPVDRVNLWPGTAIGDLVTWQSDLPGLGMVHSPTGGGGLDSRTTSSDSCGSQPFGPGTAADHEPVPERPAWCVPEARFDQDGPFASCPLADATVAYNAFGWDLQQAAAAAGRGQEVVFWPWDWRRSPADQVEAFHEEILRLQEEHGVRPTVVAHSFGNLFFREWLRYVDDLGGSGGDHVGRFLSVAGPWWGTAEAWTHPAFGQIQPGFSSMVAEALIGPEEIASAFSSFPGIYELLPTRAFGEHVRTERGGTERWLAAPQGTVDPRWISQSEVPDVVEEQLDTCPQSDVFDCLSRRFYEEAELVAPPVGFDTDGVAWAAIVGTGVATPEQICSGCAVWPDGSTDGTLVTADVAGNPVLEHRIRTTSGDGNVPLFSAIQGDDWVAPPGDDVPFYFTCGITHTDLMIDGDVLAQTIPYLLGDADLTYSGALRAEPETEESCDGSEAEPTTTTSLPIDPPAAAPAAAQPQRARPSYAG